MLFLCVSVIPGILFVPIILFGCGKPRIKKIVGLPNEHAFFITAEVRDAFPNVFRHNQWILRERIPLTTHITRGQLLQLCENHELYKTLLEKAESDAAARLVIQKSLTTYARPKSRTEEDNFITGFLVEAALLFADLSSDLSPRPIFVPTAFAMKIVDYAIEALKRRTPKLILEFDRLENATICPPLGGELFSLLLFFNAGNWPRTHCPVLLMGDFLCDGVHVFPAFLVICILIYRRLPLFLLRGMRELEVANSESGRANLVDLVAKALFYTPKNSVGNQNVQNNAGIIVDKICTFLALLPIAAVARLNTDRHWISYGGIPIFSDSELNRAKKTKLPVDQKNHKELFEYCIHAVPVVDASLIRFDSTQSSNYARKNTPKDYFLYMTTDNVNSFCSRHDINKLIVCGLPYYSPVSTNQGRTISIGRQSVLRFPEAKSNRVEFFIFENIHEMLRKRRQSPEEASVFGEEQVKGGMDSNGESAVSTAWRKHQEKIEVSSESSERRRSLQRKMADHVEGAKEEDNEKTNIDKPRTELSEKNKLANP